MSEGCCNGHCRRKTPIRVLRSALTGKVYALTRWKDLGNERIESLEKHDVSTDVHTLMARAWDEGYARDGDNPYRESRLQ